MNSSLSVAQNFSSPSLRLASPTTQQANIITTFATSILSSNQTQTHEHGPFMFTPSPLTSSESSHNIPPSSLSLYSTTPQPNAADSLFAAEELDSRVRTESLSNPPASSPSIQPSLFDQLTAVSSPSSQSILNASPSTHIAITSSSSSAFSSDYPSFTPSSSPSLSSSSSSSDLPFSFMSWSDDAPPMNETQSSSSTSTPQSAMGKMEVICNTINKIFHTRVPLKANFSQLPHLQSASNAVLARVHLAHTYCTPTEIATIRGFSNTTAFQKFLSQAEAKKKVDATYGRLFDKCCEKIEEQYLPVHNSDL